MAAELPHNQQQYEGASWGEEGFDGTNSHQHIHNSAEHTQDAEVSVSHASGETTNGADDGYDPESLSAPQVPSKKPSPSPQPTGKPKTSGGFIVGSSDDEDEDTITTDPLQAALGRTSNPSMAPSSLQVSPAAPAQPENASAPSLSVNNGSVTGPGPALVSPTKTRNLLDIVGALEDRVREDPRGDMEAWLALIAEHRRRNRFDDLRQVYNRFLEIFPQAVRRHHWDLSGVGLANMR